MKDLGLLPPKPGFVSDGGYAVAINDFGVIVAEATRAGDSATVPVHTVILTPVL
jgi:hypothetical protein